MKTTLFAYPETTTDTLAASEVPTSSGDPESTIPAIPDLRQARCARVNTVEDWTPQSEEALVPTELTVICRECPVRQACLDHALEATSEKGYWAATTSADRRRMRREGLRTTRAADSIQDEVFDRVMPEHNHDGEPSLHHYNRGCRAQECRQLRCLYRQIMAR